MDEKKKKHIIKIVLISIVNVILLVAISWTIATYSQTNKKNTEKQNSIDVKNVSELSATIIGREMNARKNTVESVVNYNNSNPYGISLEEFIQFLNGYYKTENYNYNFQLVNSEYKGYQATCRENKGINKFEYGKYDLDYTDSKYLEIQKICDRATDNYKKGINYTTEYIDVLCEEEAFAYYGTVRVYVSDDNEQKKYEDYVLFAIVEKSKDTEAVNLYNSYEHVDNCVVDVYGNYIIKSVNSNSNNLFLDIKRCNGMSENEYFDLKNSFFKEANMYYDYLNSKNEESLYVWSEIKGTNWYMVTLIPKKDFVAVANAGNYMTFMLIFTAILFVFDIALIWKFNQNLKKISYDAERASVAKTDFLAHMSHDIRTPINGIKGLIEIIQKNIDDKEKVSESVEKMNNASMHLLSLINDVLDMSRIESGKTELTSETFDLQQLVKECYNLVETQGKKSNIKISVKYKNISQKILIGSPLHIRQIIVNILSNAVKYNIDNGYVDFEIEEEKVDENHTKCCFVVKDSGIGMTEEFLKHIYEPFSQAKRDARTKYSGSGLGLAIVKELVEKMNGKIDITSIKDRGTTVKIEIVFENAKELVKEEIVEEEKTIEGKRILVVEDNELNREVVAFVLSESGLLVEEAEDGKQAVLKFEAASEGYFDLIFMDLMMPELNGIEATKAIRALKKADAKSIPIVAMSANVFAEDVQASMDAGMNDHIGKPIDKEIVINTIKKYCG